MLLSAVLRLLASLLFAPLSGFARWPVQTRPGNIFMGWPPPPWDATYDYVVIGGGTAGITVAARLAQGGYQVALVEAGSDYESKHPISQIPGAATIGIGSSITTATSVDWKFVAQRVPGANHRDIHYARGKCLGGSPSEGAMQKWADLVGDPSYSFQNTFQYFKRTASFTPPEHRSENARRTYNESAFDISGQPLEVSYPRFAMPFSSWVRRALTAIGMEETQDFNTGSLRGHQFCSMTIRPTDESRSSSESAFLRSPRKLDTLAIYENTLAKKILFGDDNRAIGVRVQQLWDFTLHARREIILSAGAFQSPQLLMVSGIGPGSILHEHKIKPIVTLPGVGQNMWDHIFFGPSYQVSVDTFTGMAQNPIRLAAQAMIYTIFRDGMLTNPSADYLAFEKLPRSSRSNLTARDEYELSWFPEDWPEVEVRPPSMAAPERRLKFVQYIAASAYVGNFSDPFSQQPWTGQYATIIASMVAPTSRGNVTIRSANTADLPIINPNWMDTELDQKLAVATYRRMRDILQMPAILPVLIGPEYFPGSKYQTDAEVLHVIKDTLMTIYHASCTCKMGTRDDSLAVVDHRARVFGVTGLRVVDASSFPFLPPGHPQSTVYMLAEKIAADILAA
ncbi:Dehydrogenase patE [Penicillium canariense]|uniref:Dehydrogenase patE n=1 Tax=Penicillium canariense TaxID=189055 RepID=A0A9W9LI14_9EURO|nr:Dehydrogenase patE [Penicillium canariense]KAJ5157856.1 Dehydrogenase patE [Penicillium canariense]